LDVLRGAARLLAFSDDRAQGTQRIRFVPSAYGSAYLLRLPLLKSYSGSMSSLATSLTLFDLPGAFFICVALGAGYGSGTNEAHAFPALCEHYDQNLIIPRVSDQDESLFGFRVPRIIDYPAERIGKYSRSLLEGDAMLGQVVPGFVRIPIRT
jgi:hypothetical protein